MSPGGAPQKNEYIYIYIYIGLISVFSLLLMENVGFNNSGFWLFPWVLEGLGRSGRLVGTISTYPGIC